MCGGNCSGGDEYLGICRGLFQKVNKKISQNVLFTHKFEEFDRRNISFFKVPFLSRYMRVREPNEKGCTEKKLKIAKKTKL